MAALATPAASLPGVERPRRPLARREAKRLFEPGPGRGNLEDRILALWDWLGESGEAECPVCAGGLDAHGRCRECGSELR